MNTAEFMTVAPAPAPVAAPSSRPATGSKIDRRSTELVATFFGEVVWSTNDGDNPRTIFRVNHRGASVACIAGVLPDQLEDEQTYRFLGRWEESKYGPQFQVSTHIIDVPISAAGVVKYLTTFAPSLGKSAAGKLLARYGADVVQVLRETPERVHADCVLSLSQAQTAAKELEAGAATELTKLELFGLLDKRGFRREIYDRLIGKWGVRAPGIIRRDPYRLLTAKMPGAGFKRTDKLWIDLGLPRDAIKRQTICGWAALQNDRTGHTWFRESEVKDKIEETIRGDGCNPVRAITLGVRAGLFEKYIDAKGLVWLAEASKARDERRIAHAINCLLPGPNHWPADLPVSSVDGDGLPSEHQRERALRAVSKPVGILAGGPGTGKTHTLAFVLRELLRTHSSSDIAVVAPTGKAAVRATQSLERIGLGALRATTIHSLLEIGRNGHDGDGWGFLRNATNPLDCRFVIVDEASMIDANLLACLLDACKRPTVQTAEVVDDHGEVVSEAKVTTAGTHVLFIGDPGQLSPVGHGAPLRDLIASGSLGFGELSEVRRNAGQIVHACQRIRAGKEFETSQRLDLAAEPPLNLKLLQVRTESQAVAALEQTVQSITKWDRVWQTQIIVPLNTKGQISRVELNKRLRKLLNPDGHSVPGMPFSVGDKVVCLRNSWIPMAKISPWAARDGASSMDATKYRKDGDKEQYVANGEIGRVIAIATGAMILQMDGKPPIRVPVGKQRATEEDGAGGSGSGSGGTDDSGAGQGCSFDHAYALTAHKMQGSETPLAIVMADSAADTVAGREWWYTAISRAAQACIIIGSPEVIDRQSKKQGLSRRKTFLRELLEDVL